MSIIFWSALSLLFYVFIGYPCLLKLLGLISRQQKDISDPDFDGSAVSVSIILSVFNEAPVIAEKIENFLALDYPDDNLELIIISDQSTDRTNEIIRSYESQRIRILIQSQRQGKTLNLNLGVTKARGDIVIFTDANSMFATDVVKKLMHHFREPTIGLVSGRSVYLDSKNSNEEIGGTYRAYEEMIKAMESRIGSIVGADGAIYALRKELYEPLRSEFINDFAHTGQVVLNGYQAISEPDAICREVVDETHRDEFARQTRMMAQSWLIYFSQIGELLLKGKLIYAWELTSHKLLRWLVLPIIAGLFLANILLLQEGEFYIVIFAGQLFFWVLVGLGKYMKSSFLRFPYLFFMVHYAAILGFLKLLTGNIYTTWTPRHD
jgi:cellulose synthase/poly-beta-1,6-N-acetylglucosamine synthase-like glycosyltransferase